MLTETLSIKYHVRKCAYKNMQTTRFSFKISYEDEQNKKVGKSSAKILILSDTFSVEREIILFHCLLFYTNKLRSISSGIIGNEHFMGNRKGCWIEERNILILDLI